jgi:hypothetical protein
LECKTKKQGAYRIVLAGSSFAMGHLTREDETFAVLLPVSLSQETGRKIELYNEGMVGVNPHTFALRFDEVLAAKPDLILWTLTPWDVQNAIPSDEAKNPNTKAGFLAKAWFRVKATFAARPFPDAVSLISQRFWQEGKEQFEDSSIAALLQHFIFESKSQYVKSSLMAGDSAGYLNTEPDEKWERRLRQFDSDAADIEARAEAAKVPLVAVLLPNRVQAAMISTSKWPAGYDPYMLDDELRTIIVSHGGVYIDIFPDLRSLSNPEQGYFPIDGHPDAEGHKMISRLLTKELTGGAVPGLKAEIPPKTTMRQGT